MKSTEHLIAQAVAERLVDELDTKYNEKIARLWDKIDDLQQEIRELQSKVGR